MSFQLSYADVGIGITHHPVDIVKLADGELGALSDLGVSHHFQPAALMPVPGQGHAIIATSEFGNAQIALFSDHANLAFSPKGRSRTDTTTVRNAVLGALGLLESMVAHAMPSERRLYGGCSITCEIEFGGADPDTEIMASIQRFLGTSSDNVLTDITHRYSYVVDSLIYTNIAIQNFREFQTNVAGPTYRVDNRNADRYGIQVSVDVNNRYGFNIGEETGSSLERLKDLTTRSFQTMRSIGGDLRESIPQGGSEE